MTHNEVAHRANQEAARANRAREKETERSNRANEELTKRGQNLKATTDTLGNIGKMFKFKLGNHFEWYNGYPDLISIAGKTNFKLPNFAENYKGSVMCLNWAPVIGKSGSFGDAINTAVKQLFAVLKANGYLTGSWESPEIVRYFMVLSSGYSLLAMINRIYNLATKRDDPSNAALTYGIAQALQISRTALDKYREQIWEIDALRKRVAARLAGFNLPKVFSFIDRHIWLNSNIFQEQATKFDKLYVFSQKWFYKWDFTESKITASNLINVTSLEGLIATVDAYFGSFINNDDVTDISATMLRAFGDILWNPYDLITEELVIGYDHEVLMQIRNATITGDVQDPASLDIKQDNGVTYQGLTLQEPGVITNYSRTPATITFDTCLSAKLRMGWGDDDINVEEIIRYSRLMTVGKAKKIGDNYYMLVESCGTEIILGIEMVIWQHNQFVNSPISWGYSYASNNTSAQYDTLYPYIIAKQFLYMPKFHIDIQFQNGGVNSELVNNTEYMVTLYKEYSAKELELLHYPCVISEFSPFSINGLKVKNYTGKSK